VQLQSSVTPGRQRDENGRYRNFTTVNLSNSTKNLAFMAWVRLQDAASSKPIRPAFYSDNFVSLLPGESLSIHIEFAGDIRPSQTKIVVDGWNSVPREWKNGTWRTLPTRVRRTMLSDSNANSQKCAALASSEEVPERAARYAVDGDPATRWSSARTDNQWIQLDLGTPQRIGKVCLKWESAYAKEYKLQVSNDGQTWRDVAVISDGKGGEEVRTFTPTTARYVRMLGLKRGSEYGYSLWEISVLPPDS
jgi:hypothetical protein